MKREAIRSGTLGAFRRTIIVALVTFLTASLPTFFAADLWDLCKSPARPDEAIKDVLRRVGVAAPIKDVFCRVGVDAPMPYLRCGTPAHRFEELRQKIFAVAGFDFLATCGDMKRHEKATSSKPGVAYHSRHKSGLAFDYNQEDGRLLLVREDVGGLTYWRTYLRCEKQDGTCGVRADLDTDNAGRVSAFVIDFTAAAAGLGWKRIPAQEGWENIQTKKEFWHYETDEDVAFVMSGSIAETEPGGEGKKQTPPATAWSQPPEGLAGSRTTEKMEPLRDSADLISMTKIRGGKGEAKEFAANRHAPSPPVKTGATSAPPEVVNRQMSVRTEEPPRSPTQANNRPGEETVMVMMEVEQGRVVRAHIPRGHPELEAYEAAALRIARNRRYPLDKSGTETITLKINARN